MRINEGFGNVFDSSLIDYRGDFEKKDDIELRTWLSRFIRNFNDADFDIEYINNERCINLYKSINILLLPGETKIPYKFNYVKGNFNCSWCGLTTLENCPNTIDGDFNCSYNNLTNLDFIPDATYYNLSFNQLNLKTINRLIDLKHKHERHPRHNVNKTTHPYSDKGIDSHQTSLVNITGNPRLIKYSNHPLYSKWITSHYND